jgi:hypothetical protein
MDMIIHCNFFQVYSVNIIQVDLTWPHENGLIKNDIFLLELALADMS